MSIEIVLGDTNNRYEVLEWKHASAILKEDFPNEYANILEVLNNFSLLASDIATPGGRKSPVAEKIDHHFYTLGWEEKLFDTIIEVDGMRTVSPTHKVDCYKNRIALEIEWNNKDPFFDRDLNNFRLLYDLQVISVGVIITRCDHLQDIFNALNKGASYGTSTTHMSKLLPKIAGGGGGGCPILVFGISENCFVHDI